MKSCRGATIDLFKVYGAPTTFFINREGVIKKISIGFPPRRNKIEDDYFMSLLKETEK